ncbi:MAG: phosphoenolpyruvate carboxykinase (ATP) [Bdellovibrionaceae bacterium]|nr:phosphoenolpyruvate carboxykinase (ATP) [Pseudobdellovibrionaceae bacterium]
MRVNKGRLVMQLIEQTIKAKLGQLSKDGALIVNTGKSTGRSTKERFVIRRPDIEKDIHWGDVNQPMNAKKGDLFLNAIERSVMDNQHYIMKGYVGCFKVEVYSTSPWHIAFAENMFRSDVIEGLKKLVPDDLTIKIYHDPEGTVADLGIDHEYNKAIIVDPSNLKVAIVGTAYAGEIKKSAFALCNFLFPKYGIMPMHSSANCSNNGAQSCVLFGLSGTGKTTLSADPTRYLIGDDEIVWSKNGISNLEGGCYAKLIKLSEKNEPDIWHAANRQGSILENVSFNMETGEIDFDSNIITENTRGSYSIEALDKVFNQQQEAQPPTSIVFLTADAFGALPAVSRLNEWQAQYHFISGYTAKVAGTEIGVVEPQATFSACFGAPFMPRAPKVYAELLAQLCRQYKAPVWLVNTGWVGGCENGERFPIHVSRSILTAIQNGELNDVEMKKHPVFGFDVPVTVPGVEAQWLQIPDGPQVKELGQKFINNAKANGIPEDICDRGGPVVFHS